MLVQIADLRQTSRHRNRIAAQRARLIDRADRRDHLHDLPASAVCADRHARADDLAERGQIRRHAEVSLCAVGREAESGDDLVENQHRAVPVAEIPQSLQEAVRRKHRAHVRTDRLDDNRGDVAAALVKPRADAVQIVVLRRQRVLRVVRRYAERIRHARRHDTRAGAHEQSVGVAVIAAVELDDLVPSGVAACGADRAHDRLRTGIDHAHHLDRRHHAADQLRHLDLRAGRRTVAQSVLRRLNDRLADRREVVTQNHRSPRTDEVDVFVSVLIPHAGLVRLCDEPRCRPNRAKRANRRVDAARNAHDRAVKQLFGYGVHPSLPSSMYCASSLAKYVM